MGDRHLDLDEMTGVALEVGTANQRAIDARRGYLEPVGAVDRVGDIEHRRQRPRNRLAILDLHRAVGPLGHDLDGAAGLAGDLDPDQAVAHSLQHRPGHRRHPRRRARLDDETGLGEQFGIHGNGSWIGHVQGQKRLTCMGLGRALTSDPAGFLNRALTPLLGLGSFR